ncbi:MAG TPA: ABC transporter substrate-binding protein [Sphingobacterium sp.]|nr:ABC transporter substrate-binding protein [Sphingobacterium sp.]
MKYNLIGCGLLFLLLFTQCNPANKNNSEDPVDSMEVEHRLGTTEVPRNPERIVVLDIGALETLHELGVEPVGVPKKHMPSYLDGIKNNENIGDAGSVIEPDFERINALAPNLILISTRQERFYEELSDIAPTVFIGTDNKDYLNSFRKNTTLLGAIVGKEQEAEEKLAAVEARIAQGRERFENESHKALFVIFNNGKFSAFGKGSRFGFIHDVLLIKPAINHVEESVHGQKMSNELIAETNPDYLFVVDRNAAVLGKAAQKKEIENRLIQQTKAYKEGKIFYLDPNVWFISGGGLTSVNLMVDDIMRLLE